jgi:hypothetical protein
MLSSFISNIDNLEPNTDYTLSGWMLVDNVYAESPGYIRLYHEARDSDGYRYNYDLGTVEPEIERTNLVNGETLTSTGWTFQEDGSFYATGAQTLGKTFYQGNGLAGAIQITYEYKFDSQEHGGVYPCVYYTDGTKQQVFPNSYGPTEDRTKYTSLTYRSTATKTIDYIEWTYGTRSVKTWIKNLKVTYTNQYSVGEWQHVSTTFTTDDRASVSSTNRIVFDVGEVCGDIYFRDFKLERGNKLSDWTPAPEDMATNTELGQNVDALNDSIAKNVATLVESDNSISESLGALKSDTDTMKNDIASIRKDVDLKVTPDGVLIQIQNEMAKGVDKVTTKTGFTFDDDGLVIDKTDAPTNTKITENGMTVNNNETGDPVLTANKDGVKAEDLHATSYLIVGKNSRFEDYNGGTRTGCFWIGGDG